MKSIIIIFGFCLVLPLMQASGTDDDKTKLNKHIENAIKKHGEHVKLILDIAKSGEAINGVLKLKPLENSFLGSGSRGLVFRGVRLKDEKLVAIKFVGKTDAINAQREYEMYSYMHAIDNPNVENYGLSAVYYYGEWKDFIVTAFTELQETLAQRKKSGYIHDYDILLLFRLFIKQSKYMHSCGVRHDDIKAENILFRDAECFLNDFDHASKMNEDNGGRTLSFASLRHHNQNEHRIGMDDWESFLYTICHLVGIPLGWFKVHVPYETIKDKIAATKLFGELKSNRTRTLEVIENALQKNRPLKKVFLAFAKITFSGESMPVYDDFNAYLNKILQRLYPDKRCFSWITERLEDDTLADDDRLRIEESIKRANTDISDIEIPFDPLQYKFFDYPSTDETFFNKKSDFCLTFLENVCTIQ